MHYMGLDVGQTGCKAVIFDENGNPIAHSYREYRTIIPKEGWAELDSRAVINSCFDVIKEVQDAAGKNKVKAIAVSSQGEAFTPVGKGGEFLANATITFDTRAKEISERWSKDFGIKKLYQITGHTAHPMFTIFKLLWLKENNPKIFEDAEKFLCFEDLVQHSMGVEPHIGYSLAGRTMLFDIKNETWSEEITDRAGIETSKLAIPVPSGKIVGEIPKKLAEKLGFETGALIVSGGHDQPIGGLGAGAINEGMAMYAIGTSICITPAFNEPVMNDTLMKNNLCTYHHSYPGMYTTVAFHLTGGNILRWFRDNFGQPELLEANKTGRDVYDLIMDNMDDKPTSLMVLPYFTPTGTPYFDSEVSGIIHGLKLTTTRGQILRALIEGVGYEMKLNLEILEKSGISIKEIRAIGGGAKNDRMLQLMADILGVPVIKVKVTEAACMAAAMLACHAHSGEPLGELVARWVKTERVIEPNPQNKEYYTERFSIYKKMYPLLKKLEEK